MRAWMFSSVTSRGVPRERVAQRQLHRLHGGLDRQRQRLDPEAARQRAARRRCCPGSRTATASARRARGPAPSASAAIAAVSAESMPPERPSTTRREAALARVVARAEHERVPDLGLRRRVRRRRERRRCASRSQITTSAAKERPRAIGSPGGVERASCGRRTPGRRCRRTGSRRRAARWCLRRHAAEHLLAQAVLADRERRGRQVDDRVGAGADQLLDRIVVIAAALPEVAIVPDVFADADAEAAAAEVEHLRAVKRLEVAVLVEDVVGGQERLAEALVDAPVAKQRGAVEQRPSLVGRIGLGQADQRGRIRRRVGGQLVEPCQLRATKSG